MICWKKKKKKEKRKRKKEKEKKSDHFCCSFHHGEWNWDLGNFYHIHYLSCSALFCSAQHEIDERMKRMISTYRMGGSCFLFLFLYFFVFLFGGSLSIYVSEMIDNTCTKLTGVMCGC